MIKIEKLGVDDYAVKLGDSFQDSFKALIGEAKDPLGGIYKSSVEINALLNSKTFSKLDKEKLPLFCREYLDWVSETTHSGDELMILSYLGIAGACLRKSVKIKGPVTWMYPNTWQLFLGKSGSGKSVAVDISLSMLREIDRPIFDAHAEAAKKYHEELLDYEKAKRRKKKDDSNKPKPPVYPPCKALSFPMINSLERLAEILSEDISSGLVSTSEEMASWLINLVKVENLKEFYTGCYNGKISPNFISYKNSRSLNLNEPIISINGPSTYDWVFDNLKPSDFRSGFLQRILFAVNDSKKKKQARPVDLDQERRLIFLNKLKELHSIGLDGMECPLEFQLEEEAWKRFEVLFNKLEARKEHIQDDVIISCLDRYWNDYLFKFALILHTMQPDWQSKRLISVETLDQAAEIIQYYETTLKQVINELENKEVAFMMKKIIDKLRSTEEFSMKNDDLANLLQGYSKNKNIYILGLDNLENLGVVERKFRQNKSNNQVKSCEINLLQLRG